MKNDFLLFIKQWIAFRMPKQQVYLLQYTRVKDDNRYNIVFSIGLFGIHFVEVDDYDYDHVTQYVFSMMNNIWQSFYNASTNLIYCADDAILKLNDTLKGQNGITFYLISSPKIVNNNKFV